MYLKEGLGGLVLVERVTYPTEQAKGYTYFEIVKLIAHVVNSYATQGLNYEYHKAIKITPYLRSKILERGFGKVLADVLERCGHSESIDKYATRFTGQLFKILCGKSYVYEYEGGLVEQLSTLIIPEKLAILNAYFRDNEPSRFIYENLDEVLKDWYGSTRALMIATIRGSVESANGFMQFDEYGHLYNVDINEMFERNLDNIVYYLNGNSQVAKRFGIII